MGMYTEFHYNVELDHETPEPVIKVLEYMVSNEKNSKPDTTFSNHPLFEAERWWVMLTCDSYNFAADTHSTLRFDKKAKCYYLNIRCNFKNYDNEIQKFCDFIKPYVNNYKGECVGFYRYEEYLEPTLLYA